MVVRALCALLAALTARRIAATTGGCEAPKNPSGCDCSWGRDETGPDTFRGLSHPPDYTPAEIAATGLDSAVLKAADSSPAACELVCCTAKAITDAPAAEQAPAQTGPCGTWQFLAPPAGTGCWLGLDPVKRPLPRTQTSGEVWIGGAINQGAQRNWGVVFIIVLLVAAGLYVGGGLAYNVKTQGIPFGKQAIPHREVWIELGGLVVDGVLFTKAVLETQISQGTSMDPATGGEANDKVALISPHGDALPTGKKAAVDYGATDEAQAVVAETDVREARDDGSSDDEDLVE